MESLREIFPDDTQYQAFKKTERPVLYFTFDDVGTLPLTSSKVGGFGYLPKRIEYPRNPNGEPLSLLAQINFAEMPHLPQYPETGILAFYIDLYDDLMGLNFDEPTNTDGFSVFYFEDLTEEPYSAEDIQAIFDEHPTDDLYYVALGEYKMNGELQNRILITDSYDFEHVHGTHFYDYMEQHFGEQADDVSDKIYDNLEIGGSLMGGYPFFTQEDPRKYQENVTHTELLFQLDSDHQRILWGDSGVGNFFISKEDLANRDFTNVWYNWDCY